MRSRYLAMVRSRVALAILVAAGVCAVAIAGYRIMSTRGSFNWIRAAGTPVFIADGVSLEDGRLTLENALQLDPDQEMSDPKSVPARARNKYLVFCSDSMVSAALMVDQSAAVTLQDPALRTNLVASHMGKQPSHVQGPSGTISFAKVSSDGRLAEIQTGDVSEIIFNYDFSKSRSD